MKWIRIDVTIADSPMVGAVAEALDLPIAEAVGLCTLVFAQLPVHAKGGNVAEVPDLTLEQWAHWGGKRRAFAVAFRRYLCDETGTVRDWERCNGSALRDSETSTERVRKHRETKKGTAKETPTVTRNIPVANAPNGDVNGNEQQAAPDAVAPKSAPAREASEEPAPPADRVIKVEHVGEVLFPAEAQMLLERFYAKSPVRMADAARQLLAALGRGAVLEKGVAVRAYDAAHLRWACRLVMAEPPQKPDLAVRFVLLKLRDTYLEIAGKAEARKRAAEDREKEDRLGEAQSYVDGIGGLWDQIETEVDALLEPAQRGKPSPARNILLETAVLDAFERKRTIDDGSRAPAASSGPRRSTAGPPPPPTQEWKPARVLEPGEKDPSTSTAIPAELLEEE